MPLPLPEESKRISLGNIRSPQMRAFHMSWFAFFLAFFSWFGIVPLMAVVRDDLGLTKTQVGNTIIASVAITLFARPVIGWLCDRYGPRLTYTGLLTLGSIPVMCIGLAQSYEAFLLFRLAIGVIGAAFVITQYHVSVMFAPNVVGTANATTAGWGNLGGGVTQMVMPLVFAAVMMLGADKFLGWRVAMIIPGASLFLMGIAYFFFTQDTPFGNYSKLREEGRAPPASHVKGTFRTAATDYRVWMLFLAYGVSFGVELTVNNIAALYYHDQFGLSLATAGIIAGLFGLTNLFARILGGFVSDKVWVRFGNRAKVVLLAVLLLLEGLTLLVFANMNMLVLAVAVMLVFSLFVQMSEGATYSVVPFVDRRALGSVTGIVGAGGNAGAILFGFLFRVEEFSTRDALTVMGIAVIAVSALMFAWSASASPEKSRKKSQEELNMPSRISPVATTALSITLVILCITLSVYIQGILRDMVRGLESNNRAYQLAQDLRRSSDDLTQMIRLYAVTGDPRYAGHFQHILDIRNGDAPRPQEYSRIYWDFVLADGERPDGDRPAVALRTLMAEAGMLEEELALLDEAEFQSNDLVSLEREVMEVVAAQREAGGGRYVLQGDALDALQRLHGDEYFAAKAKVMRPLNQFIDAVEKRIEAEEARTQVRIQILSTILLALIVLATYLAFNGFLRMRRRARESAA